MEKFAIIRIKTLSPVHPHVICDCWELVEIFDYEGDAKIEKAGFDHPIDYIIIKIYQ